MEAGDAGGARLIRIFLYNWPVYVATWAGAILVAFLATRAPHGAVFVLAAGCAVAWSLVSLAVSFWIYDRSVLVSGAWIPRLVGAPRAWATIHAGLDAEVDVDRVMRDGCVARLDVFDARYMTSPSIRRARLRTKTSHAARSSSPTALPLGDGSCDAVIVAFTAHEIRDRRARETFFRELHRVLEPGGRALVVEHLRDVPNFIAFGPGFLHFVARREWLRLASQARLAVAAEARVTPWVMALALERTP